MQANGLFVRLHVRRASFTQPHCSGDAIIHPQAAYVDYYVRGGQDFVAPAHRFARRMRQRWASGDAVTMFWADPDDAREGDYYCGRIGRLRPSVPDWRPGAIEHPAGADQHIVYTPWENVWVEWDDYPDDACYVSQHDLLPASEAEAAIVERAPAPMCLQDCVDVLPPAISTRAHHNKGQDALISRSIWRIRRNFSIQQAQNGQVIAATQLEDGESQTSVGLQLVSSEQMQGSNGSGPTIHTVAPNVPYIRWQPPPNCGSGRAARSGWQVVAAKPRNTALTDAMPDAAGKRHRATGGGGSKSANGVAGGGHKRRRIADAIADGPLAQQAQQLVAEMHGRSQVGSRAGSTGHAARAHSRSPTPSQLMSGAPDSSASPLKLEQQLAEPKAVGAAATMIVRRLTHADHL